MNTLHKHAETIFASHVIGDDEQDWAWSTNSRATLLGVTIVFAEIVFSYTCKYAQSFYVVSVF